MHSQNLSTEVKTPFPDLKDQLRQRKAPFKVFRCPQIDIEEHMMMMQMITDQVEVNAHDYDHDHHCDHLDDRVHHHQRGRGQCSPQSSWCRGRPSRGSDTPEWIMLMTVMISITITITMSITTNSAPQYLSPYWPPQPRCQCRQD